MYVLKYSKRFKKELKHYQHDRMVISELEKVLNILASGKVLPEKYSNHRLSGGFNNFFECHLKPDVLLIYEIKKTEVIIILLRIGSHAKLF
ncbi:MAG: type II toxin-antitoxin system YafQ family toxin [bacterium]